MYKYKNIKRLKECKKQHFTYFFIMCFMELIVKYGLHKNKYFIDELYQLISLWSKAKIHFKHKRLFKAELRSFSGEKLTKEYILNNLD